MALARGARDPKGRLQGLRRKLHASRRVFFFPLSRGKRAACRISLWAAFPCTRGLLVCKRGCSCKWRGPPDGGAAWGRATSGGKGGSVASGSVFVRGTTFFFFVCSGQRWLDRHASTLFDMPKFVRAHERGMAMALEVYYAGVSRRAVIPAL